MAYHHIRLLAPQVDSIRLLSFIENDVELSLAIEFEKEIHNLNVETVLLPRWRSYMNCAVGLTSTTPLQVHYYRSAAFRSRLSELVEEQTFDACYVHLIRMAQYAPLVSPIRTILSMTDCLTLRYERSAEFVRGGTRFTDAVERNRISRYETSVTNMMDVNIVVTEPDRRRLLELGANGRIEVVGNGVDTNYFAPDYAGTYEPYTVSFLGNMHSVPNQDAVRFLAENIWPEVRRELPEAKLQIIGINPPPFVKSLDEKDGITVTGSVNDVRPWLSRSAVTVCPVRIGAGIQNKILESLAMAVPVVTTPVGVEGIEPEPPAGVITAETATGISEKTLQTLRDPRFRNDLGNSGREFVTKHYTWKKTGDILHELLAD